MKNVSSLQIKYIALFNKQRKEARLEIKSAFRDALDLFKEDPLNPHHSLRCHELKKQYAGFYSIDVSGDWRALYKIHRTKAQIVITFHILGTHNHLYKKTN